MKIPRPKKPETEFKRKRAPPPQATKLLVASLSAGLVFMALLAIVFVPRYLENLNPPPSNLIGLSYDTTTGSPRILVMSVLFDMNVSRFNATLTRDNGTIGTLPAGLAGTSGGLSFTDANHDSLLDPGDFFTVPSSPQGTYAIWIWQIDVGHIVGHDAWTGP